MTYVIERGIPIPTPGRQKGRSKYPFRDMRPGDSFFEASRNGEMPERAYMRLASAANTYRRATPGFKYAIRREAGGARVWCTNNGA